MNRESRKGRHYAVSQLPVISVDSKPHDKEVLIQLYTQVCTSWRELIEIRFKLLGLVPPVSVLVLATILSKEGLGKGMPWQVQVGFCLFGFMVTLGLFLYDKRNSELHDDLISRGRRIEDELGINTGQFKGRLKPSNAFVKHDIALGLIYGTAILGWTLAILVVIKFR